MGGVKRLLEEGLLVEGMPGVLQIRTGARAWSMPGAVGDPLAEVEIVKKQWKSLRSRLVQRREEIAAEGVRIDAAIAEIDRVDPSAVPAERIDAEFEDDDVPIGLPPVDVVESAAPGTSSNSSPAVADIILDAVASYPSGASTAQIREYVVRSGKQVNPENLPTYIFRLAQRGKLVRQGTKGALLYTLPGSAAGAK